jgi:HEPN domain-containing protein
MTTKTTVSTAFLLHAKDFLYAAEFVLNRAVGVSLPAYFLFGLSVELSLKAYLLERGMSLKELKSPNKFGHDLAKLLNEAQRRDLNDVVTLNQQEAGVIRLLSYDYMIEKRFTYPMNGHEYFLPLIEVTEVAARKLAFGLEAFCTGSRINR